MASILRRIGRALTSRPEETATGVGTETSTTLDWEQGNSIDGMIVPKPVTETRLRPVSATAQGAPAWFSGVADFLTALGPGGTQAAQRQQVLRQQRLQGMAEQAIAPQVAAAQVQVETRKLKMMEMENAIRIAPKTTIAQELNLGITTDPITGKVTTFNLKNPEDIRKRIESGLAKIESPYIRGQAMEEANGRLDSGDIRGAFAALDNASARDSMERRDRTKPQTPGVDIPFPPEVEAQKRRIAVAGRAATGNDMSGLVAAVIANPSLFQQLPPTSKAALIGPLNKLGFTQFGKPLSDTAIKEIVQSDSAIQALKDLRQTLVENEEFIGPVAGLQSINPWSDARQAQARIDTVRQRVGRALEGGVLRKEDEEKYKKILATLTDTPTTAIFKVDSLIGDIQRDMETYVGSQAAAGRNVSGQPRANGDSPPANVLKEGVRTTFSNGQTWTLRNGQSVRVK